MIWFRTHNNHQPSVFADMGISYFKWNGGSFSKQGIVYGPECVGAGCGIQFCLADLRSSGRRDIMAQCSIYICSLGQYRCCNGRQDLKGFFSSLTPSPGLNWNRELEMGRSTRT